MAGLFFMYAEHIFTCRTTSPSLPSMRPYGIVKAIRTSSPPRRVRIGAVAVAADEPLPSPLTLDVLFVCLPCARSLISIRKNAAVRSFRSVQQHRYHTNSFTSCSSRNLSPCSVSAYRQGVLPLRADNLYAAARPEARCPCSDHRLSIRAAADTT